jgi:hypothetical protein
MKNGLGIVQVFEDAGISGAKGRKDRPALDARQVGKCRQQHRQPAGGAPSSAAGTQLRINFRKA